MARAPAMTSSAVPTTRPRVVFERWRVRMRSRYRPSPDDRASASRSSRSGDHFEDRAGPVEEVDAVVVLGVPEALDVQELDRFGPEREGAPVPGAAMQDERVEGPEPKGQDRFEVARSG